MNRTVAAHRNGKQHPGSNGPASIPPAMRCAERGFTLTELLIAAGLFMGIAFVLYTFVAGGVNMWRTGERRQDLYERALAAFEMMGADLECTFRPQVFEEAKPVSLFLADRPAAPPKKGGLGRVNRKLPAVLGGRLRFVRTILGEFENPLTRASGVVPGASGYYQTLMPDPDAETALDAAEAPPPAYAAPGGLKEVIYQAVLLPGADEATGVGTLIKGERWPVGGEGTFFDDAVVSSPEAWTRIMRPVVRGVLHLGFEFWDQYTEGWAGEGKDDTQGEGLDVWDSTRGILKEFRFYERGSEEKDIDDVYPQRVRITLVLARPGDSSMTARIGGGGLSGNEKQIRFDRPGGLQLLDEGLILVGGKELIEITRLGRTRAKIVRRGVYGTPVTDHDSGAPAIWGEVFTRVVNIPCYREYHNN